MMTKYTANTHTHTNTKRKTINITYRTGEISSCVEHAFFIILVIIRKNEVDDNRKVANRCGQTNYVLRGRTREREKNVQYQKGIVGQNQSFWPIGQMFYGVQLEKQKKKRNLFHIQFFCLIY